MITNLAYIGVEIGFLIGLLLICGALYSIYRWIIWEYHENKNPKKGSIEDWGIGIAIFLFFPLLVIFLIWSFYTVFGGS